jgi:hypothetical protein
VARVVVRSPESVQLDAVNDQTFPDILDGLNTRLAHARQLYGPELSLPLVVNGLREKLDELRRLYGFEFVEGIRDGII